MLLCLPLAACMLSAAGPIDAYRANLASVKVGADFECKFWYNYNPASLKHVLAFEPGAGPAGEPGYLIQGRWEYDGSSERYVVRATGGTMFVPGAGSGPLASVEALCDDKTFAFHYLKSGESALHVQTLADQFPVPLVGPFTWYSTYRFDRDLAVNYAGAAPVRSKGERGGHPTEVEVYERSVGDFRLREEVAYDPSIGYLPRFYRGIAHGQDRGRSTASVIELYLIDAKPCSAGGFVPTEWYHIHYNLDDFNTKYPGYDEDTKLTAPDRSDVTHFKVTRLDDKKDPARLEELSGVNEILAPGGFLRSKDDYGPITMAQLKSTLGAKARPTNRPIAPKIDLAEQQEFARPKDSNYRTLPYILAGLSLAAVAAFLVRRRYIASLLLLGLIPLNGCGQKPVPRLTAAFTLPRVLYDPSRPTLNLDLQISNAGNQTLRIMKIDAGCSCRHVDPSQLPATLKPGERLNVAVGMSGGRNFSPQSYLFTFTTDQGLLTAPVALLSFHSAVMAPAQPSPGSTSAAGGRPNRPIAARTAATAR